MTQSAVLREAGGFVRGVVGFVVVVLVAVPTHCARQRIVVVHMARPTLRGGVDPHQRESGGSVVERGAVPVRSGMALGAIVREVRGLV